MIKVISPKDYRTIPWKNGKGTTLELAINPGATLANFDWRLSIASVVENGPFSDFAGYQRNLVLIEGAGITLDYTGHASNTLDHLLAFATFDGGWVTSGQLHDGPIKDFNLISRTGMYSATVTTWWEHQCRQLQPATINFIFSTGGQTIISNADDSMILELPANHLAQIENLQSPLAVQGNQVIAIELQQVSD